ncbi:hypothetical protein Droror1_Dr00011770 [Drosera rotundifolia]
MATLSVNTSKFRTQTPKPNKPISAFPPFPHITYKAPPTPLKTLKPHPRTTFLYPKSVSERSVSSPEATEDDASDDGVYDPTAELSYFDLEVDPESITEWELDFSSRPILDMRGKKIWELVVCDSSLSLQYTKYFPNNVINSITLKEAIASVSDQLGVPLPDKIRYFRSQMQTIITKACKELSIKPIPSKRCVSLLLWLEERYETVYTRHPGFQKGSKPFLALDDPFPRALPENLFGDRWAFVQLPYSVVREEISSFNEKFAFGASLDLDLLGLEIDDNTLIPGLAVESSHAMPLAGFLPEGI